MLVQNLPKLDVLDLIKPMIQMFDISQEMMGTPLLPKIQNSMNSLLTWSTSTMKHLCH